MKIKTKILKSRNNLKLCKFDDKFIINSPNQKEQIKNTSKIFILL